MDQAIGMQGTVGWPMNDDREWIIKYHGDIKKILNRPGIMIDIINEKYAIIKTKDEHIPYLKTLIQIECMEESSPLFQLTQDNDPSQLVPLEMQGHKLKGEGVRVGWISHRANINYKQYVKAKGKSRIICSHNGIRQHSEDEMVGAGNNAPMDRCIGNDGMAPSSQVILVNWEKTRFYTADAVRALAFIIREANSKRNPLVIYFPFDISLEGGQNLGLLREIVSEMTLWGKIAIVSALEKGSQELELNLSLNKGPLLSTCPEITVGSLCLTMEWGLVRQNDSFLYGQKLRTYYITKMAQAFKIEKNYTRGCDLADIGGLLKSLIPIPTIEEFRTLDLAYEFAGDDAEIDAFIVYNSLSTDLAIISPMNTSLYPLVFPYLGVRGTVRKIRGVLSGYSEALITGSLAYILGSEPLDIKPANFKVASILSYPGDLTGENTLIGIIDTGIDYTNPVFMDSKGKTRIVSIWDQTIGNDSPYGYGTIYECGMINKALNSADPFTVVPHKDEWGSGTILAGIAAGHTKNDGKTYKGAAPGASIAVVKLLTATPTMQKIYHSEYNPLGFSALDVARAFEYLATLANRYQKPISICLPMGTNTGPHDGTSILDTIIMSYAENPGVSVVLPAGEEANKGHHASGNLKDDKEQVIKLTIPEGQGGFIVEIWAMFGDRLEVLLSSPKLGLEESVTIFLNNNETYKLSNTSSVWSQGSKIDRDTGCQVIRFRLENPLEGDWLITVKGLLVIEGRYDIWIPKTGMILPKTVLTPADPFTTIYNASNSNGLMTIACYDPRSLSPTPSSGRGFARDGRVKPDFMVQGVDVLGPLPGNKWGSISGSSVSSAITTGITSIIYEDQLIQKEELANTVTMKALLIDRLKREPTILYPNPSRGYGLLDTNIVLLRGE